MGVFKWAIKYGCLEMGLLKWAHWVGGHPEKGIVFLDGNWGPYQRTAIHRDCVGSASLIFCEGPAEN